MENIFHPNGIPNKAGISILIPNQTDFKPTTVRRDKEGHYIMITGPIHQDDMATVNTYIQL